MSQYRDNMDKRLDKKIVSADQISSLFCDSVWIEKGENDWIYHPSGNAW